MRAASLLPALPAGRPPGVLSLLATRSWDASWLSCVCVLLRRDYSLSSFVGEGEVFYVLRPIYNLLSSRAAIAAWHAFAIHRVRSTYFVCENDKRHQEKKKQGGSRKQEAPARLHQRQPPTLDPTHDSPSPPIWRNLRLRGLRFVRGMRHHAVG